MKEQPLLLLRYPLQLKPNYRLSDYFVKNACNFEDLLHCFSVCLIQSLRVEFDSGFGGEKSDD